MAFAIMRHDKIKSGAPISGSVSHITRSRRTPNADPARRHLNYAITGPGPGDAAGIRAAIEERTPAKYRRDAVRALEFVITASPEYFDDATEERQREYFEASADWLRDEFGAANVVSAVVHNDEQTPHMHALVVPIDPESSRLNAKRWVGGRGKNSAMQSRFAEWMAPLGVERGRQRVAGSGRQHTPVREWYAGHAQLDERQASLEAEAAKVAAEAAQERREAQALATRALEASEVAKAAEASMVERERELAAQAEALAQREAEVKSKALRLERLASELEAREGRVAVAEGALTRRQAEIDRAGRQLRERLAAAREERQAWEVRRDAWLAEHRPVELTRVERLSLGFAEMPAEQRIESMRRLYREDRELAEAVDQLGWVTYDDGSVTPEGRRVLAERGGIEQHERRMGDWPLSGLEPGR